MRRVAHRAARILLTGIAALAPSVSAQEAQFTGEATVNIIEVPVRVIDPATGAVVTGLTAKDFRIFENGRKVKISNFAEIDRTTAAATAGDPARKAGEHQKITGDGVLL